jgi:hypothetical protein
MARLQLPEYPRISSRAMAVDTDRLDALLTDATLRRGGEAPDTRQFLFGDAPSSVFTGILGLTPADLSRLGGEGSSLPGAGDVWILHVSGYFGGVWLREEVRRAQPDNPLLAAGQPPSDDAVAAVLAPAAEALEAARSDEVALASLLERRLPMLIEGFGYNQGYLMQILESPPGGVKAPPDFITPRSALWCDYATPPLPALENLRSIAFDLEAGVGAWKRIAEAIPSQQAEAEKKGRAVWSTGLSVDGFSESAFSQLLDLSASFLAITQATALLAVAALATNDDMTARRAARAIAALTPWQGSYGLGLMDPSFDDAGEAPLPRIVA